MVLDKAFAKIMQQQGKMQEIFAFDAMVNFADQMIFATKLRGAFDGSNAMCIDRVFVILVELQETAGVAEGGNKLFKHAQLM